MVKSCARELYYLVDAVRLIEQFIDKEMRKSRSIDRIIIIKIRE